MDTSFELSFVVRYAHVVSVALLGGGALLMCALCWAVAGLTVATGVSNIGLKGTGLIGPHTSWGMALSIKLLAVFLLLALSFVRSDFVIRCQTSPGVGGSRRARTILGQLYAVTAGVVLGVLWIGLGLAHGLVAFMTGAMVGVVFGSVESLLFRIGALLFERAGRP
jgi:hypothetical protein